MLLAIDIGNTAVTLSLLKGKKVFKTSQVPSTLKANELRQKLKRVIKQYTSKYKLEGAVLCSVVPDLLKLTKNIIKKDSKLKVKVIGEDITVPIKNCYKRPAQVGQDRLVCAYAAMKMYGCPAIIVDLGTAITLDVVSRKKEYLGGIIVPGIKLSADTLFQKAALIPKVHINKPSSLIGRDTESSILSGIFFGYGEMIKGLIHLISKDIKGKKSVIVTGGYTELMRKYISKSVKVIDATLVFKGMRLLWEEKCR